jgi:AcrR family transcriptional regulator
MTYYCRVEVESSPRPRGRPRGDAGPVLLRSDLLDAAAEAFGAGYAAMSVRALARRLGVSQATVQHHAATKQLLLYAVIDELVVPRLAETRARAATLPGRVGAAPEARESPVWGLMRARIEGLARHGGVVTAVLTDTSRGSDARRQYLLDALAPQRAAALATLQTLGDENVTRRISPTTWSVLTLVMVPSLAQAWPLLPQVDPGLRLDVDAVLDDVADVLVLGLLSREAPVKARSRRTTRLGGAGRAGRT